MSKGNLVNKVKSAGINFVSHWSVPKNGDYVPNKELATFSVGGMGVKAVNGVMSYINLTAQSLLIGSVYNLKPTNIMILFIISNIFSILKTPLASWLVDNTNTKIGKFRPYLLWAGIPTLVGIIGVAWFVPTGPEANVVTQMVLIAVFYNIALFGNQLYNNAYMGLSQVISPSSRERNKILSVSEFLANLGPSIVTLLLPSIAGIFWGQEKAMLNIWAYRIFLPIFAGLGFALGLLVMFTTKERTVVPKEKKAHVKFGVAMKLVMKNRYFWGVNGSKFFEGFKVGVGGLLFWLCAYQLKNTQIQGILATIINIAFTPGMLLAPLFMKKFGKGTFGFASFITNALACAIMLLTFQKAWYFFPIALFFFNFASGPQYIVQTSITADAIDLAQFESGERIEGFAQNIQLVFTTAGTTVSTVLLAFIYEKFGLGTNYDVLVDDAIRVPIFKWTIIIALIASVLGGVCLLVCNMPNTRHEEIINELKRRKYAEDNKDKNYTEEELQANYELYIIEEKTEAERRTALEKDMTEKILKEQDTKHSYNIIKKKHDNLNKKLNILTSKLSKAESNNNYAKIDKLRSDKELLDKEIEQLKIELTETELKAKICAEESAAAIAILKEDNKSSQAEKSDSDINIASE